MDIVLDHINKSFGAAKVLDNVSLSIPSGGTVCIMGPSGCGKTTLLNIIAGLEVPDSGTVSVPGAASGFGSVSGTDQIAVPGAASGTGYVRMAYVFQEPRLLPWLSAQENVEFALPENISASQKHERAAKALELVGLAGDGCGNADAAILKPEALSGGMAVRVSLARALAFEPDVLLLDEPFSGVDDPLKKELIGKLLALQSSRGMTIVLVTHSREEADLFCAKLFLYL